MRKPFQVVAKMFGFSYELTATFLKLVTGLAYDETIVPFDDHVLTRHLTCLKFLITTGFKNLQQVKFSS
jgi:putative hydrolase of the HAD superfamily